MAIRTRCGWTALASQDVVARTFVVCYGIFGVGLGTVNARSPTRRWREPQVAAGR